MPAHEHHHLRALANRPTWDMFLQQMHAPQTGSTTVSWNCGSPKLDGRKPDSQRLAVHAGDMAWLYCMCVLHRLRCKTALRAALGRVQATARKLPLPTPCPLLSTLPSGASNSQVLQAQLYSLLHKNAAVPTPARHANCGHWRQ